MVKKPNLAKWLDEWRLAASGIVLATKKPKFIAVFLFTFIFFGTLLNLLVGGTAAFSLLFNTNFTGVIEILWGAFLAIFGVGRNFWDFLLIFSITLLQSILIALIVLVWKKRPERKQKKAPKNPERADETPENSSNIESAGIVAGLAVLGSGCPTCGTTLLAPIIGAIFSTSGYALAGIISGVITAVAIIIAIFSLKKIGLQAYVIMVSERYKRG